MMTTTGESSTIKNSSSLSSSDLVSRFLAATPPYLYNVPPMQHNFFFSEMLRSFVQAKNESVPQHNVNIRRRKRSWKDSRDRPLELTTKERNRSQHHPATHTSTSLYNQQYHNLQSNQTQQQQLLLHHQHEYTPQNSFAEIKNRKDNHHLEDPQDVACKIAKQELENLKSIDDSDFQLKTEQTRKYFPERIPLISPSEVPYCPDIEKVKMTKSPNIDVKTSNIDNNFLQYCARSPINNPFFSDHKNKSDFASKHFFPNIAGRSEEFQSIPNFNVANNTTPDFLANPLWYPPYPLTQTYPTIDPLHFFIDLRVSGHIWDRKSNEKYFFNRNKHNSAFSVPQSKEYNRPLNLTRSESTITRYASENLKGTHYIFKNIKKLYKKIWDTENLSKNDTTNEEFDETIKSPKDFLILNSNSSAESSQQ